jgi:preprotein translocase subunit SecD
VEERTVGPSLGADSVAAGTYALVIGFVAVVVFMVVAYGLFGMFANIALVANVLLIAGVLSGLQATLTLPGIAGIILTIGMAVDANVLIFERIREESLAGRTPANAIEAGYSRAMSAILDSNVTTLIAAALLFWFGTGPVRGFAVTLTIGIVTSLFTAVLLARLVTATWFRAVRPRVLAVG